MAKASRSTLRLPVENDDDSQDGDTGSSSQYQDPAADDDENTWRASEVEGASEFLGRRPTMRLDSAVRRCRAR